MKKNKKEILLKLSTETYMPELIEYFNKEKNEVFPVISIEEAVSILEDKKINTAILELTSIKEIELLDYINRYYEDVKVFLITNKNVETLFETIRKGNFSIIRNINNLFVFESLF